MYPLERIKNIDKLLRQFLGDDFISEISRFNTIGLKRELAKQIENKVHPLAFFWKSYQEVLKSIANGNEKINSKTIFLLKLSENLNDISKIKNHDRIVSSIKNPISFYSGAFEAEICAYYAKDYKIEILEENLYKTPDFKIITSNGPVYVECKSLEDLTIKKGKYFMDLIQKIHKKIKQTKKSYEVAIKVGKDIDYNDNSVLFEKIKNVLNSNLEGYQTFDVQDSEVHMARRKDWDRFVTRNLTFPFPDIDYIAVEFDAKFESANSVQVKNFSIVGISPSPDLNIKDRILSEFARARKQLHSTLPGIIHIQLPLKKKEDFFKVLDSSIDKLQKQLQRNSRRVSGVILSNAQESLNENNQFPTQNYFFIPNYNTTNKIPSSFKPIGTNVTLNEKDIKEGKNLSFSVSNWKEIPNMTSIASFSDLQGYYQIRFWKIKDNTVRFETIFPTFNRKIIEKEIKNLSLKQKNYFSCNFSAKEVVFFVNQIPI